MSMLPEGRERRVIVLGGHITALGIVRALAPFARHIEVWDRTDKSVAARSRHCSGFRQLDIHDPQVVTEALSTLPGFEGPSYVFPSEDLTAALVSQKLDALASLGFTGVAAPWSVMETFFYKDRTHALAARLGLDYPASLDAEAEPEKLDTLRYPVILKPDVMQFFHQLHHTKAIECADPQEARRQLDAYRDPDRRYRLMAQEIIPGPARQIVSLGGLFTGGTLHAAIATRHKRQYPADFGTATYIDTKAPEAMIAVSTRLLEAAGYQGLAEVEFKIDPRDGTLRLLEVNPRLFKWHGFGALHGINLAAMEIARREGAALPAGEAIINTRTAWRDIYSDLASSLAALRSGETSVGELAAELGERKTDSVLRFDDPAPFAYLTRLVPQLARGGRSAL